MNAIIRIIAAAMVSGTGIGHHVPEPRNITLVGGETGVAIYGLQWTGKDRASGQLDLIGEGTASLGTVRVSFTRNEGRITGLVMYGPTAGVDPAWALRNGIWHAASTAS